MSECKEIKITEVIATGRKTHWGNPIYKTESGTKLCDLAHRGAEYLDLHYITRDYEEPISPLHNAVVVKSFTKRQRDQDKAMYR